MEDVYHSELILATSGHPLLAAGPRNPGFVGEKDVFMGKARLFDAFKTLG